jgi:voltage-gated potassium channel
MSANPTQPTLDGSNPPVGPVWLFRMFHVPTATSYQVVHNILNLVIFVAAITGALETVDSMHDRFHGLFATCETVITLIFTLEYIGHVTTAKRKRDYIFSFWGLIDLLAILPTYLQLANITALKSTRSGYCGCSES